MTTSKRDHDELKPRLMLYAGVFALIGALLALGQVIDPTEANETVADGYALVLTER